MTQYNPVKDYPIIAIAIFACLLFAASQLSIEWTVIVGVFFCSVAFVTPIVVGAIIVIKYSRKKES